MPSNSAIHWKDVDISYRSKGLLKPKEEDDVA